MAGQLGPREQELLLGLARQALQAVVCGQEAPSIIELNLPPALLRPAACFVTLTAEGGLRGCIGSLQPNAPLYQTVRLRAAQAACEDVRFPPVQPDDVPGLHIEISVLTPLQRLDYDRPPDLLRRLRPGVDGLLLALGGNSATFLPQVWQQAPEPETFVSRLCEKLGAVPDAWRCLRFEAYTYQAFTFGEPLPAPHPERDDPFPIRSD
jgi:uncharacterized protein